MIAPPTNVLARTGSPVADTVGRCDSGLGGPAKVEPSASGIVPVSDGRQPDTAG
jgi:hypothetical protein